jgi:hypothetical protein
MAPGQNLPSLSSIPIDSPVRGLVVRVEEIGRMIEVLRNRIGLMHEAGVPMFHLNPRILDDIEIRALDENGRKEKLRELEQEAEFWVRERDRIAEEINKLMPPTKIWDGTQGDFADYVVQQYENDEASSRDNSTRRFKNLSQATKLLFAEYQFPLYPNWTVEQCYGLVRRR